jgi:hypothetical protein
MYACNHVPNPLRVGVNTPCLGAQTDKPQVVVDRRSREYICPGALTTGNRFGLAFPRQIVLAAIRTAMSLITRRTAASRAEGASTSELP